MEGYIDIDGGARGGRLFLAPNVLIAVQMVVSNPILIYALDALILVQMFICNYI